MSQGGESWKNFRKIFFFCGPPIVAFDILWGSFVKDVSIREKGSFVTKVEMKTGDLKNPH